MSLAWSNWYKEKKVDIVLAIIEHFKKEQEV